MQIGVHFLSHKNVYLLIILNLLQFIENIFIRTICLYHYIAIPVTVKNIIIL